MIGDMRGSSSLLFIVTTTIFVHILSILFQSLPLSSSCLFHDWHHVLAAQDDCK